MKGGNVAAVLLFIVVIVVGGSIYTLYELKNNAPDRINLLSYSNDFSRLFNQVFKESQNDLEGYYYNETCYYFDNKPRPPNSSQFLDDLGINIEDLLADKISNLEFDVDYSTIHFNVENEYELNNDSLIVVIDNLSISDSNTGGPSFSKNLNGTYIISSSVGKFYNNLLAWFDRDLDGFSNKVVENLKDKDCLYTYCFCGKEPANKETEVKSDYHVIDDKNRIRTALDDSISALEIEGFSCSVSSQDSNNMNINIRKKHEYGVCSISNVNTKLFQGGEAAAFIKSDLNNEQLSEDCSKTKLYEPEQDYLTDFISTDVDRYSNSASSNTKTLQLTYALDVNYDLGLDIVCSKDDLVINIPVRFVFEKVCDMDDNVDTGPNICLGGGGGDGGLVPDILECTCDWLCVDENMYDTLSSSLEDTDTNVYYADSDSLVSNLLVDKNIGCMHVTNYNIGTGSFDPCCCYRDPDDNLLNNDMENDELAVTRSLHSPANVCYLDDLNKVYSYEFYKPDDVEFEKSYQQVCCCHEDACAVTVADIVYDCQLHNDFDLREMYPAIECTGDKALSNLGGIGGGVGECSSGTSKNQIGFGQGIPDQEDYQFVNPDHYADNIYEYYWAKEVQLLGRSADYRSVNLIQGNSCSGQVIEYKDYGMVCYSGSGEDDNGFNYYGAVCSKNNGDSCHDRTMCDWFGPDYDLSDIHNNEAPDGMHCDAKNFNLQHNQFLSPPVSSWPETQFTPSKFIDFVKLGTDNPETVDNWADYGISKYQLGGTNTISSTCMPSVFSDDWVGGVPSQDTSCCGCVEEIHIDGCPWEHYYSERIQHHQDLSYCYSDSSYSVEDGYFSICLDWKKSDDPLCADAKCDGSGISVGDGVCTVNTLGGICGVSDKCTIMYCGYDDTADADNPTSCFDSNEPITDEIFDSYKNSDSGEILCDDSNVCNPRTCQKSSDTYSCSGSGNKLDGAVTGCNKEYPNECYKLSCVDGMCRHVSYNDGESCNQGGVQDCTGRCDDMKCVVDTTNECTVTACNKDSVSGTCKADGECGHNYNQCCGDIACTDKTNEHFFTGCTTSSGTCCNIDGLKGASLDACVNSDGS